MLSRPQEGNLDYIYHPKALAKDVLLLGKRAYADVVDSVKFAIARHGISAKRWREQIEGFKEITDVAKAEARRIETEGSLDKAEKAIGELGGFLDQVNKEWKETDNCVIGHILRSPHRSMSNISRRIGGFRGRSSRSSVSAVEMITGSSNTSDRLLPLSKGVIADDLIHTHDMWDSDGEPCFLVAKRGNATGTTLGRANGLSRPLYQHVYQRNLDGGWIINYDSKSDGADICGRIGGMLTSGSGKPKASDVTEMQNAISWHNVSVSRVDVPKFDNQSFNPLIQHHNLCVGP